MSHMDELKAQQQVLNTKANLALEGLEPSEEAVQLSYQVALGNMTSDEAVQQLQEMHQKVGLYEIR